MGRGTRGVTRHPNETQHSERNEKPFLLWRGYTGTDETGTRQEDMSRMPGDFLKAVHTGIPHFGQKRKQRSPGHPSRAAQVAYALVPAFALFPAQLGNQQALSSSPEPPSPSWNPPQVTGSLGSHRWRLAKGPLLCQRARWGLSSALWGCLVAGFSITGEFPSCLRVSSAQPSFLQKLRKPSSLRRDTGTHGRTHWAHLQITSCFLG